MARALLPPGERSIPARWGAAQQPRCKGCRRIFVFCERRVTTTTGSDDSAGASRFAREPLALVLAGGCGSRLAGLTAWQTKAAVPFGGRYRAIDFTLSNCVNSGLRRIALLTQYKSQSLIGHVHGGWGFLHRELGEYRRGLARAAARRRAMVRRHARRRLSESRPDRRGRAEPRARARGRPDLSLDYSLLLKEHAARGADVTVACVELPPRRGQEYDAVVVGDELRVERSSRATSRASARSAPENRSRADGCLSL